MFLPREPREEEQNNPKTSRIKKIIEVREEIHKIEK